MDTLEEGNLSAAELAIYDRMIDARRVAESVKETQIRIGREEGKAQGKAEGKAEGIREKSLDIARNLLAKNIDLETIAQTTGLTITDIKKLKKN